MVKNKFFQRQSSI